MMPNQDQVLSALRTILAFGAGLAVSHGWLTDTTATQLVGAGVVLVPLIWGMFAHRTNGGTNVQASGSLSGPSGAGNTGQRS